MSAELDIYRNKKEKEAKMMIEREHMIAEGLITSGDTLTILFTKNMVSTRRELCYYLHTV